VGCALINQRRPILHSDLCQRRGRAWFSDVKVHFAAADTFSTTNAARLCEHGFGTHPPNPPIARGDAGVLPIYFGWDGVRLSVFALWAYANCDVIVQTW
jgi:hypothetical protein